MRRGAVGVSGVEQPLQLRLNAMGHGGNLIQQQCAVRGSSEHGAASRARGRIHGIGAGDKSGLAE